MGGCFIPFLQRASLVFVLILMLGLELFFLISTSGYDSEVLVSRCEEVF